MKGMRSKSTIGSLPVYKPGKPIEEVKKELGLTEVIKLASNENPYGASPEVLEAIQREFSQIAVYPDGGSMTIRAALSEHLGVGQDQVIFGNGSDEIINMICRAYLEPGDRSVMAFPTFPQYRHNSTIEGAEVIEVPLVDGKHDLDKMQKQVNDHTKVIWICNPNNPTGTIVTNDELTPFMEQVPKHVLVVLDEAYCEYIDDPNYPNTLELLGQYDNLIVLRTFSKIYGLASLRIGYGVGNAEVIRHVNQVREPFNSNRMAQAAALAALQDQGFVTFCREKNRQGLEYFQSYFDQWGLDYYPAYGNFITFNVGRPASEVFQGLLQKGFITRTDPSWELPNYLRITVGTDGQNEKLIHALAEVLGKDI
jgi:histidinol-phosphate aminotransferase